jgi:hypothetical protein
MAKNGSPEVTAVNLIMDTLGKALEANVALGSKGDREAMKRIAPIESDITQMKRIVKRIEDGFYTGK